jgi:precorrin-6A/cobalt-precorrin-6A reductase
LLLGGTADALALAARLHDDERFAVTTSLAGRVAQPKLPPGEVRIGGYGGADGLGEFLRGAKIDAVIDATHPFAAQMSRNAVAACTTADVPLVALTRPRWQPQSGDRWDRVADAREAAARARAIGTRIFLTIGRQGLDAFAAIDDRWFLIRSIDAPETALPAHHELVLARGPFAVADEAETLRAHAIDAIVTKDSGGDATEAKLTAARDRGTPVVVIDRPPPSGAQTVATIDAAVAWLVD